MSELFNIGKSFELPTSQDYSSSQNLVLVKSGSPKLSSKITARTENLLAIHKKILLHLRNERTLTKFELRKLLAILKRTDCSSSRDQKIAQSAHDIIIKCVYSQTSKDKDRNLQRNSSNTTSDSSTTDEHQPSVNTSDDSDAKQLRSEAEYTTDNSLQYTFTEYAATSQQNELDQYMDPISQGTSDDIDGQQLSFDANSKTPDNFDNSLKYKLTQNAPMAYQTELTQYMDPRSQGTPDDIDSQQLLSFNANSNKSDNSDNCLKYTFTQNAPMAHQTELNHYMVDDIHGEEISLDTSENHCSTVNKLHDAFPNNATDYFQTASNQHLNVISGSNIFSGETLHDDGMVSYFKKMLSSNDSNITPRGTNVAVSEALLKRHEVSLNSNIDNERFGHDRDNVLTEPFSVPPLLENRPYDDDQQSNVLKLRLADVKFDSDTVSIPIELLTNHNFGSPEGQWQNERTPRVLSPDYREKNGTVSVNHHQPSNQNNLSKSPFTPITHYVHQNQFLLTQSSSHTSQESSVNTNNIEWINSHNDDRHTTSKLDNKQIEKISCATTLKSSIDISSISSFSRNTETPIFNVEMKVTNSEEPNLNKDGGNSNGTMSMSADFELDVHEPSLPLEVHRGTRPTQRKNISNVTVAIVNGENLEYSWCTPINGTRYAGENFDKAWLMPNANNASNITQTNKDLENVWHTPLYVPDFKNKIVDIETADVTTSNDDSVPVEEAMDLCKSWIDEQRDLEMTENEKRYMEMAANSAETETNNFTFDQKNIRKVMSQTNVDDSEQGSFVFNLDADYSSDLIEGTPFEKLGKIPLTKKIKTIPPKHADTQILTKSPRIISETLDIIIEETPYSNRESQEETPCINGESPEKIMLQDSRYFSKQHKLFNPYKKWPRSNTFQEIFKSNYQRKSPRIERGKTNIIKNVKVNEEAEKDEGMSQSQSLGIFTSKDQPNNFVDKPATTDVGDPSSSERLSNDSSANNSRPPTLNNPSRTEPTTSKNQEISENIVLIDGSIAKNSEDMDITQVELEEEEESFEENARRLEEKIEQKRNKYKEGWNNKSVNEKVSLKYVRKFGVNIFEDPVSSLLNIEYKANANNFYFPRLTKKEMNEKLKKSSEQAKILNEALTKMIDLQISSSTSEDYQFKIARNAADSDDSSDEDEHIKDKRMLEEIKIKSRLEMKNFMEDMEKERKEEIRLKKETVLIEQQDDVEQIEGEQSTEEEPRKLVELLRKTVDCSWLK